MCDCYTTGCKICGVLLPVHLGDYMTKRGEIEVFCRQHLPIENVRIFRKLGTKIHHDSTINSRKYKPGWMMGIRPLTENAIKHKNLNNPNIGADFEITDR